MLPAAALADLTADLCGKLATGLESVHSEGVRTSFHIDTVEGRATPVPHCYVAGWLARDTRFRILLPTPSAWNGKLVFGLGGGYGGSVDANNDGVTLPVVSEGYAFAQSDEGREAPVFDARDTWQELHYVRNHQTAMFAKGRVQQRYGRLPSRTYLFGSSGGGWRSLSQLERYPE
ncbi:MAG TPA: tannase/feruloyl esterase family alpha/beta hydrolase, partial [Myxococcaceae bacterium]|nr:tannase/feruloyl esterase family alpha/beta hydrolase [Myxococcaceae bacterium]